MDEDEGPDDSELEEDEPGPTDAKVPFRGGWGNTFGGAGRAQGASYRVQESRELWAAYTEYKARREVGDDQ